MIITEYRLGNSLKIKDRGETDELVCPECGGRVKLKLFKNMDIRLKAEFPVLDPHTVYFLVCPKCAGIFTVDEDQGDLLASGQKYAVGPYDLKKLRKFK